MNISTPVLWWSLSESAFDETLFNNQAGILRIRVDGKLPWPLFQSSSNICFWRERERERERETTRWDEERIVITASRCPYSWYSGQWSTAFTNNVLPQAPTDGMKEVHARTHTHILGVNYTSNQKLTTHSVTNTVLTFEFWGSHSGAVDGSVLLGFATLRHRVIGSRRFERMWCLRNVKEPINQ